MLGGLKTLPDRVPGRDRFFTYKSILTFELPHGTSMVVTQDCSRMTSPRWVCGFANTVFVGNHRIGKGQCFLEKPQEGHPCGRHRRTADAVRRI